MNHYYLVICTFKVLFCYLAFVLNSLMVTVSGNQITYYLTTDIISCYGKETVLTKYCKHCQTLLLPHLSQNDQL